MNIVKKLTLRHLAKNKSRTIVTTLGICVSVAMITAVFVSIASFMNFYGEISVFSDGNWHAVFTEMNTKQVEMLKADTDIESVGLRVSEGPETGVFKLVDKDTNIFGRERIYAGDETNLKQMITAKIDGEFPKNENEIAVEEALIERNKLDWKLGDTVSISLGKMQTVEGETHYDDDGLPYTDYYEEYVETEVRQFKLVGILHHNNPTYRSFAIIRGLSEAEKNGAVNAYITIAEPNNKSLDLIRNIEKSLGLEEEAMYHGNLLDAYFAVDEFGTMATVIIPLGLIILSIIIAASVMLIYNAFGMSLSERTRYLGMLGSVGATKQQKKESVYYEGFFLGAISIPLGTLGGILGIAITLRAVSDIIIKSGMITNVADSGITMKAVIPFWAIVGIVFFSALTIFISSYIPAKRASSITPIEALRQNKEIKLKAKNLKTPKYVRSIFGYEGELAHKNLKRNGRKSRVITASIAVSVILFLSVNSFISFFNAEVDLRTDLMYQIEMTFNYEYKDEIVEMINEIEGIDGIFSSTLVFGDYYEQSEEEFANTMNNDSVLTAQYKGLWDEIGVIMVNAIDDEAFNALCDSNGIDYNAFYKENLMGMLMNNEDHKKNGSEVFNESIIGKEAYYGYGEVVAIEIGGLVSYDEDNYVCKLNREGEISLFVPESQYFALTSAERMGLAIKTKNHADVYEKLLSINSEGKYSPIYFNDIAANVESLNATAFVLQVFTYGFITLITLVTLANIINTISTSVALRRREFAMLKSVGTTQKGFYKMICLESAFYGLKALAFGLPISALLSYGMVLAVDDPDITFKINWLLYGAVILAVFAIIGISMLYSVSKLKNDSIVGTLNEDIS